MTNLVNLHKYFPNEIGEVPEQDVARWTKYPAWHPKIIDYDLEIADSLVLLAIVLTSCSAYLTLKWSYKPPKNKKYVTYFYKDGIATPTTGFTILLSYYILITGMGEITYWTLDVGKLWSVTGVLHNVLEIAILILIHNGGKLQSNLTFAWLGGYILLVTILSMKLTWPYDGIWFKIQGLCPDYAIIIQFVRVYFSTRKNLREANDEQLPLNNQALPSVSQNKFSIDEFFPNYVSHPNQIILLILGSIIHLIGNIANSIWIRSALAYIVTWPLYAYYIFVDTHCAGMFQQKRIYLPETRRWKVIFVTILTITLSIGTVRFALFVQNQEAN
ncbi:7285_t:CDS:2 [Funneliformis mosseae]|uniref:7285_t:CDS:1 n=1 Tax=Funneliformis mosseae TaxID=27381 RepID=A0A9N9A5U3_FUNMO|nr:7285_t:CDS:2 [Funneliformis mosseae]